MFQIALYDTYGDGWQGGFAEIGKLSSNSNNNSSNWQC